MSGDKRRKLGRFEVIKPLGRGSQGSVYLGWDPTLERRVAIKVLHSQTGNDAAPLEGRIGSKLNHPNIVSIYEAGQLKHLPYLVFEFVKGVTARQLLDRDGALSVERACALMGPILEAMAHAHDNDVIHLDLSPVNIIVDESGVPRIMDFGLARLAGAPQKPSDYPKGTLRYMSPEHFSREPLGPHTDVQALALIFYELVVGAPARPGNEVFSVLEQILADEPDMEPLSRDPERQRLARFLKGGLEKDLKARYTDGRTMRDAFRTIMHVGQTAHPSAPGDHREHGTVDFLLRRMERRGDFPALSSSLAEITRLTSAESNSSAKGLSQVILRDYALTQKLLKLANSAFYGRSSRGEVSTVSQAVKLLGFEQIRQTAYGVTFLEHFQRKNGGSELADALVRAFATGLITRHLASQARLPAVEEAFICGMFHDLGAHLVLHYFPEDHAEIHALMEERGLGRSAASRAVLGITYGDLGHAVAKTWKLPETIANSIAGLPNDEVGEPRSALEQLGHYAAFSNELCLIAGTQSPPFAHADLLRLSGRFAPSVPVPESTLYRTLDAALRKLGEFGPILGLNLAESRFCKAAHALLEWRAMFEGLDPNAATIDPPATHAGTNEP